MGKLILLGLPIGNLGDLSPRVAEALRGEGRFVVEDTRSFHKLLNLIGANCHGKKIESFHDQSSQRKLQEILNWIKEGEVVYLLSEAGSPVLSDPGHPLVKGALDMGLAVDSYPGVTAVTFALELSGLPPAPFTFHGWVPRKKNQREEVWRPLATGTHLFFESPHRIRATVDHCTVFFPHAQFCLGRELSKKFQTLHRFTADQWPQLAEQVNCKGEFVMLFHLNSENKAQPSHSQEKWLEQSKAILESPKGASKKLSQLISTLTGRSAKEVYQLLVK